MSNVGMPSLACDVAGAGAAVVFIHAFPLNRRMWSPQIARLRGHARVIAVDLPGFGRTPPVQGASIVDFADAVAGVLDRLESTRAVVVGCSMGGYVAQALAVRYPARVAALGLANTRARSDTADVRVRREELVALVRAQGMAPVADRQLPKLLSRRALSDPAHVALVREMIGEATPQGLITAAAAMASRPDMMPALPAIPCPAAVIAGTEDAIIPVVEAEEMAARLPRGRCVWLEGAGHLANLEAPDEFTAAIDALLHGDLP
jgi:pimeloyl-ACP methyl ester carboxylesterase